MVFLHLNPVPFITIGPTRSQDLIMLLPLCARSGCWIATYKWFRVQDALTWLAWYTSHRLCSGSYFKEFTWVRVWQLVSCHTCSLVSQEPFIQHTPCILKMPNCLSISRSILSLYIWSGDNQFSFFVHKWMFTLPLAMMTWAQIFFFFYTRISNRGVTRSDFLRRDFYNRDL